MTDEHSESFVVGTHDLQSAMGCVSAAEHPVEQHVDEENGIGTVRVAVRAHHGIGAALQKSRREIACAGETSGADDRHTGSVSVCRDRSRRHRSIDQTVRRDRLPVISEDETRFVSMRTDDDVTGSSSALGDDPQEIVGRAIKCRRTTPPRDSSSARTSMASPLSPIAITPMGVRGWKKF